MTLQTGQMLNNRYRIDRLLGQGGFGAVYLAWDHNLDEAVAIKESLEADPAAERQFRSEARLLFKLRHSNLPRVHDCFAIPGQGLYLSMDYIEGESLAERLERAGGPLPVPQALAWIGQICEALDYLHRQAPPVIHRDIKPANIIIAADGSPYLVDFGISKLFDPNRRTTVGARALTPGYSPPEQYGVAPTDARSDIFALGSTLYHLLTGQAPPAAMDVTAGVARPPAPPHVLNPGVPEPVSLAVMQAIRLNRDERWSSARDFKLALLALSPAVFVQPAQPARQSAPLGAPPTQVIEALHAPDSPTLPAAPARPKRRWPARRLRWRGVALLALLGLVVICLLSSIFNWGADEGDTWTRPQDGMQMVFIPAGDFLMGSAGSDGAQPDELPQHTVSLEAYWIAQTEVTNAMFRRFVTDTGYEWGGAFTGADDQPVVSVSWEEAVAYCEWAGVHLPSEAQWEKAARGPDGRLYPWGDQPASCEYAVMDGGQGDGQGGCGKDGPWPGGSRPDGASPYGILDMSGNVWEWVADWYSEAYYRHSPSADPGGPELGEYRVVRGGSWNNTARHLHAAYRERDNPGVRFANYGFRCAR